MAVRGSIPWNDRFLGGKEVGNIMVSNIKCCRDVGVIFLRRLYYTTNFWMTSNLMIISLIQITKSSYIMCREQCFKSLDLGERYCQQNCRNWQNLIVVSEVSGFHLWKENKENNESPWEPLSLGQVRWKVWELQKQSVLYGNFWGTAPLKFHNTECKALFLVVPGWHCGGSATLSVPWRKPWLPYHQGMSIVLEAAFRELEYHVASQHTCNIIVDTNR